MGSPGARSGRDLHQHLVAGFIVCRRPPIPACYVEHNITCGFTWPSTLLNDFLTQAAGSAQPCGIFVQGDGLGHAEKSATGFDQAHSLSLTDKLGVIFRNPSYQSLSGNLSDCADVLTTVNLTSQADIMKLRGSLMHGRPAQVLLSVAASGRIRVALYDVAGRQIRLLADRVFPAGDHTLQWVGTNDQAAKVARGGYFVEEQQRAHRAKGRRPEPLNCVGSTNVARPTTRGPAGSMPARAARHSVRPGDVYPRHPWATASCTPAAPA